MLLVAIAGTNTATRLRWSAVDCGGVRGSGGGSEAHRREEQGNAGFVRGKVRVGD